MSIMPKICKGKSLGFIPARGGSKSIKLKNLSMLGNCSLIAWVTDAARNSKAIDDIVCSTDHQGIADEALRLGIRVSNRSPRLADDETHIKDVLFNYLMTLSEKHKKIPEFICLLQPTSPFIQASHIDICVQLLIDAPEADSAQTIREVPHNFHAYNQRSLDEKYVDFFFKKERESAYNKQKKPKLFSFGNLVVTRSLSIINGSDCFGHKSIYHVIHPDFCFDVDTAQDLTYLQKKYD